MAFGFSNEGGTEIVPILKFDARRGFFFRVDRADGVNDPVNITTKFKAVMDFENVEVGYINFPAGAAPEFRMVRIGQTMPENPGGKFRQGVRIMLKLGKECGGDIREIATTSKAVRNAFDTCHTAYINGLKANPGKLPIVSLDEKSPTIPITSQGRDEEGNALKTTNYAPVLVITSWVDRPADLVFVPKGGGHVEAAPAYVPPSTPPSTGAQRVSAPEETIPGFDDDFG